MNVHSQARKFLPDENGGWPKEDGKWLTKHSRGVLCMNESDGLFDGVDGAREVTRMASLYVMQVIVQEASFRLDLSTVCGEAMYEGFRTYSNLRP